MKPHGNISTHPPGGLENSGLRDVSIVASILGVI
jgi:hypothetical protein